MKKFTILLIPALLALNITACKDTPVTPTSSGEQPSSESEASSEPLPEYATVPEAITMLQEGSYQLDLLIEIYDDDDEEKVGDKLRLLVQDKKLQGLTFNNGRDFVTLGYLDFSDDDTPMTYYQYNGQWLKDEGLIDPIKDLYEDLEVVYNMFVDIERPTMMDEWTYDAQTGIYHGVGETSMETVDVYVQMTETFFSEIKMLTVQKSNGMHGDITFTVSNVGTTEVVLPDTPVTDIFNKCTLAASKFRTVTSFTVEASHFAQDGQSVIDNRAARYSVIIEKYFTEDQYLNLYIVRKETALLTSYYLGWYIAGGSGQGGSKYNNNTGEWEDISTSQFENEVGELFFVDELDFNSQETLVDTIYELFEVTDSSVWFSMDYSETMTGFYPEVLLEFDENDYMTKFRMAFRGDVYEIPSGTHHSYAMLSVYQMSKINDTQFDYPAWRQC